MGVFSGIIGGKKESATSNKTALAVAARIKTILCISNLEPLPAHAAQAFQLASDPAADTSNFVQMIESDEALSARVVRIANSVYFLRGDPVNEIEKAVATIGLNELRSLLSATMLKSLLQGNHPAREYIWANAVATGICCRHLTQYTANISDGEAFLCGLMHDVGKLIMIRRGGKLYDRVLNTVSSGTMSFVEAEEEIFETNHVEVGTWAAETWHFPPSVVQAIATHHEPFPDENRPSSLNVGQMVHLADTFVHAAGIGHPAHFRGFQRSARERLDDALDFAGISDSVATELLERVARQFEEDKNLYEE